MLRHRGATRAGEVLHHLPRALLVIALLAATPAAAAGTDVESRALELEGQLMAPCCGANTLADHDSGPANQMKREIRSLLAAGESEEAILARYVGTYGETILSTPPATGFNLVAYLAPTLALLLGPLVLWKRLRRRPAAASPAGPAPAEPLAPHDRERLERALREG